MSNLRTYSSMPVHIVEYHNEVLPYIYRAIGSKHLPMSAITMLHFDAHPDLVIPDIPSDLVFNKFKLFDSLSIENWIIPALYAGHIDSLYWFKPKWAGQMNDQDNRFIIGHDPDTMRINVNLREDYFISEGNFMREGNLADKKIIDFHVKTIENDKDVELLSLQNVGPYILDVDLDFFSTKNPIKEILSPGDYKKLKSIYNFPATKYIDDTAAEKSSIERMLHLRSFKKIWEHVQEDDTTDDLQQKAYFDDFKCIYENVQKNPENSDIDCALLHDFGCTCDDPELPHHVSSTEEIDRLVESVERCLKHIASPPTIITISRSSEDDYCPKHQVDEIENKVLEMLKGLFDKLDVKYHYKEE